MKLISRRRGKGSRRKQAGGRPYAPDGTVGGLPVHPATGLYRWWVFRQRLVEELARAKRHKRELSVVLLEPKDLLVEPPGPLAYGRAAVTLRGALRVCDVAAQFDEERFIVLLPETDMEGSRAAGKRLLAALSSSGESKVLWHGAVVSFPEDGADPVTLVDRAFVKLYKVRRAEPASPSPDRPAPEIAP